MSRVLKRESKKIIYETVKDLIGINCDCCGEILPAVIDTTTRKYFKYYDVLTGHHDWGNDSCDSMKCQDICPKCINKFVQDYLEKGTGTEYIEVATKYVHPKAVHVDEDDDYEEGD